MNAFALALPRGVGSRPLAAWPIGRPLRRRRPCVLASSSSLQQSGAAALEVSQALAAARAAETRRRERLVWDPWAAGLAALDPQLLPQGDPFAQAAGDATNSESSSPASSSPAASSSGGGTEPELSHTQLLDVLATRHIDEALLNALAATSVNTIQGGDFRQLVLLGDGFDTRAFRLPLPEGTLVFIVAPPEVHEAAQRVLGSGAAAAARAPRGCLLRRVPLPLPAAGDADAPGLGATLAAAGYQADRLSVWALQGLQGLGLGGDALRELLGEAANSAAFHSLVVGELPAPDRRAAENLLAESGLLGALLAPGEAGSEGGGAHTRWGSDRAPGGDGRWLFASQQQRLSLAQMGILEDHSSEQVDEDFFGHFS